MGARPICQYKVIFYHQFFQLSLEDQLIVVVAHLLALQ